MSTRKKEIKNKKEIDNPEIPCKIAAMQKPYTYTETIECLRGWPTNCPLRVERKVAKQLLMENRNVHCDGRVFYLGIRDIGLGLCEVWKADLPQRETKMFPKKNSSC